MASSKRKRKSAALDRKGRIGGIGTPAQPGRHRDGDRRRRPDLDQVREVLRLKQWIQDWTIDSDGPMDLPPETG